MFIQMSSLRRTGRLRIFQDARPVDPIACIRKTRAIRAKRGQDSGGDALSDPMILLPKNLNMPGTDITTSEAQVGLFGGTKWNADVDGSLVFQILKRTKAYCTCSSALHALQPYRVAMHGLSR